MALLDSHTFGTLEVNDGATYAVCRVAFGALEPTDALLRWLAGNNDEDSFGGVAYKDQVHALTILVQATSTALLNDALSSLRAAARSGVRWNVLLYGHDTPVWAQVSSVVSNIPAYVPNRTQYTVELKVTTRPGWRGAWADGQWATVSGLWGYADIAGIGGTMPADTAVWLATQQAAQVFGWGLRSAPVTGYLPLQDYSGTATANAKGQTSDLVDMAASFETIGAPASLDADAHRTPTGRAGRYAVFARFKQDAATDANTTLRVSSLVTGVGMTRTTSIPTGATPATAAVPTASGFEVANLGVVSIPCTNVPAAHSGVGYADETALVDQATAGTTVTIRADQEVARTLTWPGGRLTAIEITTEAAVSGSVVVALYAMPGSAPASRLLVATQALTAADTYKIPIGPLELAAGTYAVGLSGLALTMTGGAVTDAAVDLFFRVGSGTWHKEIASPSKISDLDVAFYASGELQITWTAADEASIRRIHIQRATDSGFTADVVDDYAAFDATSHIDSGLTIGTVYYYRVRAQDATGNHGEYSDPVSMIAASAFALVSYSGTYDVLDNGGWRLKTSGNLVVAGSRNASVLVVAGGGSAIARGGGGAGGLLTGSQTLSGTMEVTVGGPGGNSVFGTRTAVGGGSGGRYDTAGGAGGSGGGGAYVASAGAGTSGQGHDGGPGNETAWSGGGGGGANAAGGGGGGGSSTEGGAGGAGLASSITGMSVFYAGGGAGYGGTSGVGGGGSSGGAGAEGTGGGGGGANSTGSAGGSGIVIVVPD